MLGFSKQEAAVPVEQDPVVIELRTRLESRQREFEQVQVEETLLKGRLDPAPNAPTSSEADRHEALSRLEITKGSTRGWYLPERLTLQDEIAALRRDLEARKAEARRTLDGLRHEARKPLVMSVVKALESLVESHERVLEFDTQWDDDRAGGRDVPARTPMTTVTRGEIDSVKAILEGQGWI